MRHIALITRRRWMRTFADFHTISRAVEAKAEAAAVGSFSRPATLEELASLLEPEFVRQMPRERNRGNEPRRSDDLFASDGLVDILANPSEYGSVR